MERLQVDELKNPRWAEGLGLPCVASKANSLFQKQTCRLVMDPNSKQYGHVRYWLGLHLRDYFPDMAAGPHAELVVIFDKGKTNSRRLPHSRSSAHQR